MGIRRIIPMDNFRQQFKFGVFPSEKQHPGTLSARAICAVCRSDCKKVLGGRGVCVPHVQTAPPPHPEAITGRATLAACFRCGRLVRRSPRPFGLPSRGYTCTLWGQWARATLWYGDAFPNSHHLGSMRSKLFGCAVGWVEVFTARDKQTSGPVVMYEPTLKREAIR
jgi:hypothetical protein